jgi:hypothetical protein
VEGVVPCAFTPVCLCWLVGWSRAAVVYEGAVYSPAHNHTINQQPEGGGVCRASNGRTNPMT